MQTASFYSSLASFCFVLLYAHKYYCTFPIFIAHELYANDATPVGVYIHIKRKTPMVTAKQRAVPSRIKVHTDAVVS